LEVFGHNELDGSASILKITTTTVHSLGCALNYYGIKKSFSQRKWKCWGDGRRILCSLGTQRNVWEDR